MMDICGDALTWRKDKAILLGGFPRKARENDARADGLPRKNQPGATVSMRAIPIAVCLG